MCSLKHIAKCANHHFNKVYYNICKWQEALQLLPWLTKWLYALGVKVEQKYDTCNAYDQKVYDRTTGLGFDEDYDFSDVDIVEDEDATYRRRRAPEIREVGDIEVFFITLKYKIFNI